MNERIAMISLGCAKNQVNAEQMMYLLREAGFRLTGEPDGADAAIVNTCGFIDAAKSEAIDKIIELGALKEAGRLGNLLVTGCLSERYRQEVLDEMPEVDGVLGVGSYPEIVSAVRGVLKGERVCQFGSIDDSRIDHVPRVLSTPEYYSYLKIAEGCDNHCAYCVIPSLRGKYRSRPMEELLNEARALAENGTRELIVIAQDTSRYGLDLYGEHRLAQLLRALCKIEKLHWIRVHYLYPDEMTDELISVLAGEEKIVKYLDIPIQHINDEILRRMNRRGTRTELTALFCKLRERIPGLVLRTSLITGLPGEGASEFDELCNFLREFRLERVGAFAFSPEEGTPAETMAHPDSDVAAHRAELLSEMQSRIMDEYNESLVGTVTEVLCEGWDERSGKYFGRTYADSPDIDGQISFTSKRNIPAGTFLPVCIEGAVDGELFASEKEGPL